MSETEEITTIIMTGAGAPGRDGADGQDGDVLRATRTLTASGPLVVADLGGLVILNTSGASTLTVPTGAWPDAALVNLMQGGAGQVTVVGASGVTIRAYLGLTKTAGQWALATLIRIAPDEWVLSGNLVAA